MCLLPKKRRITGYPKLQGPPLSASDGINSQVRTNGRMAVSRGQHTKFSNPSRGLSLTDG